MSGLSSRPDEPRPRRRAARVDSAVGRRPVRPSKPPTGAGSPSRLGAAGNPAAKAAAKATAPRPAARAGTRAARPSGASRPTVPRAGSSRPPASARSRIVAPEQRSSSTWVRGAILASILLVLAVTLLPTARSLVRQRSEIAALQSKVVEQDRNVADLRKEQERWSDPAYVEQQARERLKFVKVGDRSYSVIDASADRAQVPAGAVVAAPSANSTASWYGQLWQSVQLADRPAAGMLPVPDR